MVEIKVKLTFTEEVLGTSPTDPEIYKTYVASKAPDAKSMEEEVEAHGIDEVTDKARTVFSTNKDGELILWDYQIKGFFKDACGMLRNVKGTESSKIKAYKKYIDGLVFNAGATLTFTVKILKDDLKPAVIEWLDYGQLRGLGQWRNSGKGTFTYEILE